MDILWCDVIWKRCDVLLGWYGYDMVWRPWCGHDMASHVTSTSRTSHHIITYHKNTSRYRNLKWHHMISCHITLSQPYHTYVTSHDFCIKSHWSHAISFHTTISHVYHSHIAPTSHYITCIWNQTRTCPHYAHHRHITPISHRYHVTLRSHHITSNHTISQPHQGYYTIYPYHFNILTSLSYNITSYPVLITHIKPYHTHATWTSRHITFIWHHTISHKIQAYLTHITPTSCHITFVSHRMQTVPTLRSHHLHHTHITPTSRHITFVWHHTISLYIMHITWISHIYHIQSFDTISHIIPCPHHPRHAHVIVHHARHVISHGYYVTSHHTGEPGRSSQVLSTQSNPAASPGGG